MSLANVWSCRTIGRERCRKPSSSPKHHRKLGWWGYNWRRLEVEVHEKEGGCMAYQVQLFLNRPVLSTQSAQQTQQTRNGRTRIAQSIGSQDRLQHIQV